MTRQTDSAIREGEQTAYRALLLALRESSVIARGALRLPQVSRKEFIPVSVRSKVKIPICLQVGRNFGPREIDREAVRVLDGRPAVT